MIRCLIVEDEPIAVRVLRSHLDRIPDVEIAATCTNAIEALSLLRSQDVDLVFLDIEMPALTGIGFVEALRDPPHIIFTTAHREYAVRGFELDAVDYLLKPIDFPRLLRALGKYRRLSGLDAPGGSSAGDSMNVRVGRRTVRIELRDVVYIEGLSDYVIIHTDSKRLTTKLLLKDLEEQLTPHGIVRIHRSFLAALDRVDSFTSTEIRIGEVVLPVSRSYRRAVMERLETGTAGSAG